MSILTIGRRVHYVMNDTKCRPIDVVRVWSPTTFNGVLLLDGSNDSSNLPWTPDSKGVLTHWVTSVNQDEDTKSRGTWHWPEREDG